MLSCEGRPRSSAAASSGSGPVSDVSSTWPGASTPGDSPPAAPSVVAASTGGSTEASMLSGALLGISGAGAAFGCCSNAPSGGPTVGEAIVSGRASIGASGASCASGVSDACDSVAAILASSERSSRVLNDASPVSSTATSLSTTSSLWVASVLRARTLSA